MGFCRTGARGAQGSSGACNRVLGAGGWGPERATGVTGGLPGGMQSAAARTHFGASRGGWGRRGRGRVTIGRATGISVSQEAISSTTSKSLSTIFKPTVQRRWSTFCTTALFSGSAAVAAGHLVCPTFQISAGARARAEILLAFERDRYTLWRWSTYGNFGLGLL